MKRIDSCLSLTKGRHNLWRHNGVDMTTWTRHCLDISLWRLLDYDTVALMWGHQMVSLRCCIHCYWFSCRACLSYSPREGVPVTYVARETNVLHYYQTEKRCACYNLLVHKLWWKHNNNRTVKITRNQMYNDPTNRSEVECNKQVWEKDQCSQVRNRAVLHAHITCLSGCLRHNCRGLYIIQGEFKISF